MEIEIPSEPPKESSPAPTTPTAQIVNPATNPELITPEELRAILIEMSGNGFRALAKSCPILHSVVIRLLSGGKPVPPAATTTGRTTRSSTAAKSTSSSGKGGWKPSERVQRRLRKPVPIPVLKEGEIPIDPSLVDSGGTIVEGESTEQ
jgi:hypothetical protein